MPDMVVSESLRDFSTVTPDSQAGKKMSDRANGFAKRIAATERMAGTGMCQLSTFGGVVALSAV